MIGSVLRRALQRNAGVVPPSAVYYVLLDGTGDEITTPDTAGTSITTLMDLRVKIAPNDWTPAVEMSFINKYDGGAGQATYYCAIQSTGNLNALTSPDGTTLVNHASSEAVPGVTDGVYLWLRQTVETSPDEVKHYYSNNYNPETLTGDWNQIGTTISGGGNPGLFDGNVTVRVGNAAVGTIFTGKIYYVQALDVIGGDSGDLRYEMNPAQWVSGATWVSTRTGETWTLVADATVLSE